MNVEQAIHEFWGSFGVPAYNEYSVPDTAELPYIVHSNGSDIFGNEIPLVGEIFDESISWRKVTEIKDKVSKLLGWGGAVIKTDNGYIWIKRGSPFAQQMGDEDKSLKRIVINITVEFFENP